MNVFSVVVSIILFIDVIWEYAEEVKTCFQIRYYFKEGLEVSL